MPGGEPYLFDDTDLTFTATMCCPANARHDLHAVICTFTVYTTSTGSAIRGDLLHSCLKISMGYWRQTLNVPTMIFTRSGRYTQPLSRGWDPNHYGYAFAATGVKQMTLSGCCTAGIPTTRMLARCMEQVT